MNLQERAENSMTAIFSDMGGHAIIRPDEPMSGHTTLGIGGPADIYIAPRDAATLSLVLGRARANGLPVMPLGGGSNVLVSDRGIDGVVVSMGFAHELLISGRDADGATVEVGAGVPLQRLLNFLLDEGLTGLEGLAGIPGQVGGAIAGNAGSFGAEIKDAIQAVTLMDWEGNVRQARGEEIAFEYRRASLPFGSVLVDAKLRFSSDEPDAIRERMSGFLRRKKQTQPIGERSAGCVFKNPEGMSAGQMIDSLGLKGMRMGDVEISPVHANFFVNRGRGRADEFSRLMAHVTDRVREALGIELQPEIRMVGRW